MTGSAAVAASNIVSKSPFDVTPEILTGRKYLVVRPIQGGEGETELDAQKRIVREFYACVHDVGLTD